MVLTQVAQKTVSIIVSSETGFHIDALARAAKNYDLKAEVVLLNKGDDLKKAAKKAGDAVIWRSSGLDKKSERASLAPYLKDKVLINETVFLYPYATSKYFQQSIIKSQPNLKKYSIPTYKNQNMEQLTQLIAKKQLSFPIIAKPDAGDQGKGIVYFADQTSLQDFTGNTKLSKNYVYQSFITNNGDWRVLVLGGVPLGALKRTAKKGSFLNNISQGAESCKETDENVLAVIYDIAVKAASVFSLRFTGVDIVYDEEKGQYRLLEINTAPQWNGEKGFEAVVGVDVADKLMGYVSVMLNRKDTAFHTLVNEYYSANIQFSNTASFHYHSRMWLWTGAGESRKVLDDLKGWYIGNSDDEIRQTIASIIADNGQNLTVNEGKQFREKYFAQYSQLKMVNALLFKVIFSDSIYGIDIRPFIKEHFSDTELVELFNRLINDHDAQRVLSTHAANYFYLLKNYFNDRLVLSSRVLVDPYEVIQTASSYWSLIESGDLTEVEALKQQIYLLTHIVLGESRFYQKHVTVAAYKDVVRELETIIRNNYSKITLDNKCEFLVCAQLCGMKTSLESIILDEATASKSWAGNFIVDMLNIHKKDSGHNIRASEHRNVLYVMATSTFANVKNINAKHSVKLENNLALIGRLARIKITDLNGARILARVDTGATTSSIHCASVTVNKDGLRVNFGSDVFGITGSEEYLFTSYKKAEVKRQGAGKSQRYTIPLNVEHNGTSRTIDFTLASRDDMLYPVLLGRNYLSSHYLVDTSKQFINPGKRVL